MRRNNRTTYTSMISTMGSIMPITHKLLMVDNTSKWEKLMPWYKISEGCVFVWCCCSTFVSWGRDIGGQSRHMGQGSCENLVNILILTCENLMKIFWKPCKNLLKTLWNPCEILFHQVNIYLKYPSCENRSLHFPKLFNYCWNIFKT